MAEVGEEMHVPVIDLYTLCQGDDPQAYPSYLVDGLHFNER